MNVPLNVLFWILGCACRSRQRNDRVRSEYAQLYGCLHSTTPNFLAGRQGIKQGPDRLRRHAAGLSTDVALEDRRRRIEQRQRVVQLPAPGPGRALRLSPASLRLGRLQGQRHRIMKNADPGSASNSLRMKSNLNSGVSSSGLPWQWSPSSATRGPTQTGELPPLSVGATPADPLRAMLSEMPTTPQPAHDEIFEPCTPSADSQGLPASQRLTDQEIRDLLAGADLAELVQAIGMEMALPQGVDASDATDRRPPLRRDFALSTLSREERLTPEIMGTYMEAVFGGTCPADVVSARKALSTAIGRHVGNTYVNVSLALYYGGLRPRRSKYPIKRFSGCVGPWSA